MRHNVAVVGIGNLLCSDDGLGVHFIRRFLKSAPDDAEVIDGGTSSVDLLPHLAGRKKVIFIDAIDVGDRPGAVFRIEPEQLASHATAELSVHDADLATLLRMAELTGDMPEQVVIFAVQVKSLELGMELSHEVAMTLDRLEYMVRSEIKEG
ncbi:MAG: hydrogenase maturation protease [Candidatus Geothermincolia bacterium]